MKDDQPNIRFTMLYVKYANESNENQFIINDHPLLETLFNDAPDAIFILDSKKYSILECNSKALDLFETQSKSSLISLPSFRLYDSEPIEFSRNLLEMNIKNGGEHTQEMAFRTLKQNIFWGKLAKKAIKIDGLEYIVLRISKAVDYLRAEEALSALLRGTAKVTGSLFFKELSKLLCRTFDVKYAFVGKLSSGDNKLQIMESCGPLIDKEISGYSGQGTLIENVLRGYTTFYPSGAQELFPNDAFARSNNIDGFMGTPVYGSSGEVTGLLAFMHNSPIHEVPNSRYILSIFASRTAAEIQRIRSKEILKEQARKLATSNTVKDKLLSVISHDLINPLHSVMGFSELLRSKINQYKQEKIVERVEIIDNSIKNIYFLLENLADWSRIYRNKIRPHAEYIPLKEMVNENLALFQFITEIKELVIHVDLNDCPVAFADKHMLNSIIRNLLSNAIKYTSKGGTISVGYTQTADTLVLSVKDTGIGISDDEINEIIHADCNIPELNFVNRSSTGLGLVLAKNFIERIKGKLSIESIMDKGTEVYITLPHL